MRAALYSYWRSTAAYRVRIALNLKGVDYDIVAVDLKPGVDAQRAPEYANRNPQRLLPFFEDDGVALAQSMAILEYLEERYPEPRLLPADAQRRGEVRAVCQHIACDVHPLNNIAVLQYLEHDLHVDQAGRDRWYAHWVERVFASVEQAAQPHGGPFTFGDDMTMADILVVAQVYNARRFSVPLERYPTLVAVTDHCNSIDAFSKALPERQPDAPDQ